jgi:hypothetical protein
MIHDFDVALRQLLVTQGELDAAEIEISFDMPTRERITQAKLPTLNLYLYDLRENLELREMNWDTERVGNQHVRITRRPLRVDLAYIITCWANDVRDQHLLLWRVLETFARHATPPDDFYQGALNELLHPVQLRVAQSDGVLKNIADFWNALQIAYQPSIQLTATLDLDLNQITTTPLVLTRTLHLRDKDLGTNQFQDVPLRADSIVEK